MGKKRKKKKKENSDDNRDREAHVDNRALIIEAWKARDELYKNLFGNYTHVSPANYAPPSPLPSAKVKSNETDTADPGDPDAESQHLAVLAYAPDPLRP